MLAATHDGMTKTTRMKTPELKTGYIEFARLEYYADDCFTPDI